MNGNFTQQTYPIIPNDIARVDVNRDGMVNVADLVIVASDFGTTAVPGAIPNPDVNNDGFVNREDLLLVMDVLESEESIPDAPASIATVSLSPGTIASPAIGEQLTLSLNVVGGQNVAGYQATVQFDATALRYVESANGDYLPAGAFFIQPVAEGNTVTLAATSLAGETLGDGTLATLTFEVVAVKASTVLLADVLLTNSAGDISIPQRQPSEISAPPELSDTNTTVRLSPVRVQSPAIGEQLMFSVNIANGEDVAGYQATVQFDTTTLRYVESANGDYLPAGAFFIPSIVDGNTVTLAASSLAGETMGDGTLATLTFEVVAVKTSTVLLSDVLLTDSAGGSSVPQIENAEITVPPELSDINTTVRLSPVRVQSPAIGEQLMFSVNIANGEDVAGYQATVQFDTTTLRYVESANGDYLPAGAFFIPPIVDGNTVTLAASSLTRETMGDGTLATLTFEVVAVKASTVRLSDVLLTDSTGGSSVPQIENAEITESSLLPEDVNEDGVVNIIDLTLVASNFGKQGTNDADVNGDGVVNIIDLMLVDAAFGNTASAPEIWSLNLNTMPTRTQVETWLREVRQVNLTDPAFQRGILVLEQLLAALTPKETTLLPNYPNPFNPETWIPYQLTTPSDVSISIYSTDGKLIRTLDLGHQPIGKYHHRSLAAHWDGKNAEGESVASGVYFYTLTAGKFTATRKMLIRK